MQFHNNIEITIEISVDFLHDLFVVLCSKMQATVNFIQREVQTLQTGRPVTSSA